jgi:hypothetical protein
MLALWRAVGPNRYAIEAAVAVAVNDYTTLLLHGR